MSVRISAHDWVEGGITPDDAVEIARAFKAAGADMIDVLVGPDVSTTQKPVYGRMYQTPFADRIRNEAGIPTIAVGAISEADHVNSIIAAGRADLCALARPHLADPSWTLHAAAQLGYDRSAVAEAVPRRPRASSSATCKRAARPGDRGMSRATAGSLDGRHAVVTGGGRGIGAAIARRSRPQGAQVTLLGRNAGAARGDSCEPLAGRRRRSLRCDRRGRRRRGVRRGRRDASARSTILVNNAGQREAAPFVRTSLELLRRHARRQPDRHVPVQPRGAAGHARARASAASSTSRAPPA